MSLIFQFKRMKKLIMIGRPEDRKNSKYFPYWTEIEVMGRKELRKGRKFSKNYFIKISRKKF